MNLQITYRTHPRTIGFLRHVKPVFMLTGISLVFLAACVSRPMMTDQIAGLLQTGMPSFEQEEDLLLLENAFPANIKLAEALLANDPGNQRLLVLLARLYAGYLFSVFETRFEKEVFEKKQGKGDDAGFRLLKATLDRYYQRGGEYALRALSVRHEHCRTAMKQVKTAGRFINSLKREDVPALFWYGYHLSGEVHINRDSVKTISRAYLIEMIMKKVIELDPDYFNGNAHLILFVYYASRPPMMGGDLDKSLRHYERMTAVTGDVYWLKELYYARYFLTQKQEKEPFVRLLSSMIQKRPMPDRYRLYNTVAAERAKIYLENADTFFDD